MLDARLKDVLDPAESSLDPSKMTLRYPPPQKLFAKIINYQN